MMRSVTDRSLIKLETFLRARLAAPLPGAEAQWKFAPTPAFKGWRPDDQPATRAWGRGAHPALPRRARRVVSADGAAQRPAPPSRTNQSSRRRARSRRGSGGGRASRSARRNRHRPATPCASSARCRRSGWSSATLSCGPSSASRITGPSFAPQPREVAQLIEAPVTWLRDPITSRIRTAHARRHPRELPVLRL